MRRKKSYKKLKRNIAKTYRRKSKKNPNYVYLICSKCGKSRYIRTNNKKLYTKEIRKNNICIFCK